MPRRNARRQALRNSAEIRAALVKRNDTPGRRKSEIQPLGAELSNWGFNVASEVRATARTYPWPKHEQSFYGGQNTKWNAHLDNAQVEGTLRDMGKGADFW